MNSSAAAKRTYAPTMILVRSALLDITLIQSASGALLFSG
jgi:hypothetical protein